MKTNSLLIISFLLLGMACKKKEKTESTPQSTTPTEEYNYTTLRVVAADIVGPGYVFSFTGTPKCRITYNGNIIDSMSLAVATIQYSLEPSGTCTYFNGSYTMNSKSFKIRKGGNNFLEFHDNTGLIGKWEINDNGTPYTSYSTGNFNTSVFCCTPNGDYGFKGK